MFHTSIFLALDRDEMYRNVCYTFNFLWSEIYLMSKMFYSLDPLYFNEKAFFDRTHKAKKTWTSYVLDG